MYKKILSLCLVLLMALSCFGISVSAYTPSLESVFEDAFVRYLQIDGSTVDEEFVYVRRIGSAGKYDVYRAYYGEACALETSQIIGDYMFTYGALAGDEETNPTGLYAYNGAELMTLKEAYDKDLVDLDELYEEATSKDGIIFLGENNELKTKCKTAYIEQYGLTGEMAQYSQVVFAIQYENYAVFRVYPGVVQPMESFQYIDGYWFWEGNLIGDETDNPTGLYTLDNYGNVQSLSKTVNEGFIDLDEIYPVLSEATPMYMAGDIDGDKQLTVKDATLIQKYLVKIPEAVDKVYDHYLGLQVMDADLSGGTEMFGSEGVEVNIKDATYVQKKVAKIIKEEDLQPFEYGEILVTIDGVDIPDYTVEDFPEYAFKSIEINKMNTLGFTMIILELETEGKANVIDAINSLRYRVGTEFMSVYPNYLIYAADD